MKIINFRSPNLRYIEGEGDVGGGAPSEGGDASEGVNEPSGHNPAWDDLLTLIPSQLHEGVMPHLKKWDDKFQTELQKVQSPYEPYKPFIESGATPETLQAALGFYQLAESDPEKVYREMQKYYGFGQDQGPQEQVPSSNDLVLDDDEDDPRFAALKQNQEAIAQVLLSKHQQEQEQALERQIEQELTEIKTKHPNMSEADEIMIYRIAAANGSTVTEASEELFKYNESIAQSAMKSRPAPPAVMSATGSIPGQEPIDPRKLDPKATKSLVASILEANRDQK